MDSLRQQAASEVQKWEDELKHARETEHELMRMLEEVQNSVIARATGLS